MTMLTEDTKAPATGARLLLDHWSDRVQSLGCLPATRDLDLSCLRQTLPNLWLLGVERDPLRFRMRLVGEAIRATNEAFRPGVYVDEVRTRFRSHHFLDRLHEVVETRRADVYLGPPIASHRPELVEIERVTVPLAFDGTTVDRILNCTISSWRAGRPPRPTFGR
jgi:hypothetical protein